MRNTPFMVSDVEYYLIKRKPKKGKAIYHARFFDSAVDKDGRRKIKYSKSTGQTSEAAAQQVVARWIEEGKLDIVKTNLSTYLLNFWDPEKSEYLKNKARQGKTYSDAYLKANVSVIDRLFLPYFKKLGIFDLTELTPDNLESWMQYLDQKDDVSGGTANRARRPYGLRLTSQLRRDLLEFIRAHLLRRTQRILINVKPFLLMNWKRCLIFSGMINRLIQRRCWLSLRVHSSERLGAYAGRTFCLMKDS